jgi:Kef-type K+ transport system membrane component KefB
MGVNTPLQTGERWRVIMAAQILPYIWVIVASLSAVALAIVVMILWDVRKMVNSLGTVIEGVSYLADFFRFLRIFRRKDSRR